ncbi:MAG: CHRD domain-containing protein [Candidatus Krumholzibacteriia bacterium]
MRSMFKFIALSGAILALGPALQDAAFADLETYTATLSGAQEVPPVATPATGTASIVVDTDLLEGYWNLSFSGLTGSQTGAHFHNAPSGINGGVVLGLPLGSPVNGVWAMTAVQYGELAAGNIYANVHSTTFPGGEIRGQLTLDSVVEAESESFGAVKSLFR